MIEVAGAALQPVCASPAWLAAIAAGGPYDDLAALQAASDAIVATLPWDEVLIALAAHPRIGDRAAGTGREAQWSRQEQSAAATPDEAIQQRLRAANVAYERRFDHVFLICATGRSAQEILAEATRRSDNDPEDEKAEVRRELAAIVRLRLAKALA